MFEAYEKQKNPRCEANTELMKDYCMRRGISDLVFEQELTRLKKEGVVFEVRPNYIKLLKI